MKSALIIGGGFSGCTAALMLREKGFKVKLLEKSDVLGGGCRTYYYHGHPYTFGPHHLLINLHEMYVHDYFTRFLELRELSHHTMTYVSQDDRFYTYPIHEDEIKDMPDYDKIRHELDSRKGVDDSKNFEEYWQNSIGETLYNKFIHTYSEKMWQVKNNKELDEFSFSPKGATLKTGSKQCFEGQKLIAYPVKLNGYNDYFEICVQGCDVRFNSPVEQFDLDNKRVYAAGEWHSGDVVINTASIDSVFDYCLGELRYIGRDFIKLILPVERVTPDPYHFIHYAGDEPYTRVVEYKILTGYKANDTLLGIEFPSFNNKLYPYPIKSEISRAASYLSMLPKDCYSLGRMGKYHYDNMDVIVKDCMALMKQI
ncbi:MAG: FAD-dependent oxidoreductase [Deferribacterales bacterium]